MRPEVSAQLLGLNQQFYQTFALQFSRTRQRLQPGVRRLLNGKIATKANLLDLGCGNGELASELIRRGQQGLYIGLDFSQGLLEQARQRIALAGQIVSDDNPPFSVHFLQVDLVNFDWVEPLNQYLNIKGVGSFDEILAFAVLHHLPGEILRKQVLSAIHDQLSPEGSFIHSEWQFINSPRLAARRQPWSQVGLDPGQVDAGDFLLDWREGGMGLRYVHLFNEPELAYLAQQSGFEILQSFYSDGEGGNLGLYQVWRKTER